MPAKPDRKEPVSRDGTPRRSRWGANLRRCRTSRPGHASLRDRRRSPAWRRRDLRTSCRGAAGTAFRTALIDSSGPQTLASGDLISHEHATSGTAKLLRLADGSHVVRLENLDTSNGPDLHVWLTDAPVRQGKAGWHVFDDGKYVSLGKLKGNKGSQNYALPSDVDWSSQLAADPPTAEAVQVVLQVSPAP